MKREEIYPGKVFGRLTVISYAGKSASKHSLWLCRCECGNERLIRRGTLTTGHTLSCGCYRRSMKVGFKHGESKTRLYNIWNQMIHRCSDNKNISYPLYGGRGICVCDEWGDFERFKSWALENGYAKGLVIDRIDSDSNYGPDNCRWVTQKENSNNKRNNRYLTIDGVTKTAKQWAEQKGINYATLIYRMNKGITDAKRLFDKNSNSHVRERDIQGRYRKRCKSEEKTS